MFNDKKAEMSLLKLGVGFLVFCGLFIGLFLFVGYQMSANDIEVSGLGNATFSIMTAVVEDNANNDSGNQMSVITQGQNVTSANSDPFRQTYDKGNQYGLNLVTFFPKMFGVLTTGLSELGIDPLLGMVAIGILVLTFSYLTISFIRVGR